MSLKLTVRRSTVDSKGYQQYTAKAKCWSPKGMNIKLTQ